MKNAMSITVTIRTLSAGRKLCALLMEDLSHAHSVAKTLMESPNYAKCYVVATDWQGAELFNLRPQEACVPPPVVMPQYYPQMAPPPAPMPPQHYQAYGYQAPQQYRPALPPPPPAPQAQAFVDGQQVECQIIPFPSFPGRG